MDQLLRRLRKAEFVDEGLQSTKLVQLAKDSGDDELLPKIYKQTDLQLDKIPDDAVSYCDLAKAREGITVEDPDERRWATYRVMREMAPNLDTHEDLLFWVIKTEKKSPSGQILKPGLLAVTSAERVLSSDKSIGRLGPKPPRGMGYIDRLIEFADAVYGINVEKLRRGKYDFDTHQYKDKLSAEELRREREAQKRGAVALISPEKFAEWNRHRYQEILAKRRPSPELKALADEVNKVVAEAIGKIDVSKMEGGKAHVPGYQDKHNRPLSIKSFLKIIEDIWDKLNYAQRRWAEWNMMSQEEQKEYTYPLQNYQEYLASAKELFDDLKSGEVNVYWSD